MENEGWREENQFGKGGRERVRQIEREGGG